MEQLFRRLEILGHAFAGWYEDAALTVSFEGKTMPMHAMTLYAKWELWKEDLSGDPSVTECRRIGYLGDGRDRNLTGTAGDSATGSKGV